MKVLIVDDDQMLCESLKLILTSQHINVVGTAYNGEQAFRFCQFNAVDIILMDIRMPVCDGVMGTKKIKQAFPKVKIIILTTFDDDEYVAEAIKNGASAYLLKTVKPSKIVETISLIYEGNMVLGSAVAQKISTLLTTDKEIDFSDYSLGSTHIAIVRLIAKGLSNKEISQTLHLSEGTVRNKISEILTQLSLRDRTQIAIFWHTKGKIKFKEHPSI